MGQWLPAASNLTLNPVQAAKDLPNSASGPRLRSGRLADPNTLPVNAILGSLWAFYLS